jgi:hypothetical protein
VIESLTYRHERCDEVDAIDHHGAFRCRLEEALVVERLEGSVGLLREDVLPDERPHQGDDEADVAAIRMVQPALLLAHG